ncbi:class I SAM-dependent methyltransferase [bacterium]|nr:class I SAM-dependent methyltransferase [bacterium]
MISNDYIKNSYQAQPRFKAKIAPAVNMSKSILEGIESGAITKHFVPTPITIIDNMISMLGKFSSTDKILEPSAGYGHVVDRLVKKTLLYPCQIDVIEPNQDLRRVLFKKGYNLVDYNILNYRPDFQYDKIIMNPPYEEGNDILHLLHCFNLLKPKGSLVAILPENAFIKPKQPGYEKWQKDWLGNGEFREINEYLFDLLRDNYSQIYKLGNVFKQSDVPDDVLTRMVVINKSN